MINYIHILIKYVYPDICSTQLNGTEIKPEKRFKEQKLYDLVKRLKGMDKTLLEQLIICRGNKNSFSKKSNISYSSISLMIKNLSVKIRANYEIEDFYE